MCCIHLHKSRIYITPSTIKTCDWRPRHRCIVVEQEEKKEMASVETLIDVAHHQHFVLFLASLLHFFTEEES